MKSNRKNLLLAASISFTLAVPSAYAQSGNWDVDAAGNWSAASNWSPAVVPGTAAGDIIGLTKDITLARIVTIDASNQTAGTLNIGDPVTPTASTHAFSLSRTSPYILILDNGGSNAEINKTGTIGDTINAPIQLNDNLTVSAPSGQLTLSGAITTSGGNKTLTKTGNNNLVLNATINYGGLTTVSAGTLRFVTPLSLYGGTEASWTTANINVKSGATLSFNLGGSSFSTAQITTLFTNLAASNSATEGMNAGSRFGFDTGTAGAGGFTIADVITNSTGASGGARGLNKVGSNNLTLSNANTFTGTTNITGGKLVITNPLALQFSAYNTASGSATVGLDVTSGLNSGTLTLGGLGGSVAVATAITGYSSVSNLNLNPQTGQSPGYTGVIANGTAGMTLTKTGSGRQILNTAANTYSGGTALSEGTLQFGKLVSMPATGAVAVTGGTLAVNLGGTGEWTTATSGEGSIGGLLAGLGGQVGGTVNYTGDVTLGFDTSTASPTTQTYSDAIGNVGTTLGLTKLGTNTLALGAANTYTGKTTVSGGTLQLTGLGRLGAGTYAGALDIASGAIFQTTTGTQTLTGVVGTGGGIVTNSGGGLLLQNANNAYGTLNVTGGRVFIQNNAGALAAGSTVNITTGGRLVLEAPGSPTYNQAIAVTSTVSGGISARSAATLTNVTLPGSGSFTLNNDDAPTSALAITNALALTGNLTVQVGGVNATVGDATLSGDITGASGALTKTGTGRLILSGTNSYDGATTVTDGTLAVTGSLGATAVTVSSPAILGGNGNIGGDVTIDSGATHALAVAATPGTQVTRAITGTLNLTAGNLLDLTAAATPADGVYVLATAPTISGTIDNANIDYNGITGTVSIDTASSPDRLLLTVTGAVTNDYASWANDPTKGNIPGEPASGDFDNDGITNIVEYALGMNPRVSSQPAGVLASNVITYTKGADAIANGDVSWVIETSQTLAAGSWTPQVTQPAADPALTIAYTLTPGTPAKNFARLKVVQVP